MMKAFFMFATAALILNYFILFYMFETSVVRKVNEKEMGLLQFEHTYHYQLVGQRTLADGLRMAGKITNGIMSEGGPLSDLINVAYDKVSSFGSVLAYIYIAMKPHPNFDASMEGVANHALEDANEVGAYLSYVSKEYGDLIPPKSFDDVIKLMKSISEDAKNGSKMAKDTAHDFKALFNITKSLGNLLVNFIEEGGVSPFAVITLALDLFASDICIYTKSSSNYKSKVCVPSDHFLRLGDFLESTSIS